VLGAVRDLHLLELVTETLRATLNDIAAVAPKWLRDMADSAWFERYAQRAEDWRLPGGGKGKREAYAQQVGTDGFALLDALAMRRHHALRAKCRWWRRCARSGKRISNAIPAARHAGVTVLNCRR
jgi:hypothetical protein